MLVWNVFGKISTDERDLKIPHDILTFLLKSSTKPQNHQPPTGGLPSVLLRGGKMAGVTTQKMQSEIERLYPRMTDTTTFQ